MVSCTIYNTLMYFKFSRTQKIVEPFCIMELIEERERMEHNK